MSATTRPATRSVLGLAFLTAFVDLAGFSILFPLFPALLEHYFTLEGEQSLIGRLVGVLRPLAGEDGQAGFLVQTLFGGILGSLYSVLQFLFAPVWGALSDRIGRRPTLLITLAGTALSYLVWFFAGSFALLVVARLLGGMMAGNIATVSAVIADVTRAEERSRGMGILGAAIGLGFIFGPAIGGLAAGVDLAAGRPGLAALGVNPFSFAALLALALATFNLVWAAARFPETLSRETAGEGAHRRSVSLRTLFKPLAGPGAAGVRRVNLIYFATFAAFSAMEFTLVFLAVQRFAFTPRQNALMFVFVGVLIALVQGGLIRRLAPRLGDRRLARTGLVLILPGFLLVGFAGSVALLYAGLACMAVGSAFVMPCLGGLVSRYAPADQQGRALGSFRSVGALSRAVGPIAGGLLYWRLGSAGPYVAGAIFLLLPIVLSLRLPEPGTGEAAG
jgi:MFS family permease